MKKEYIPIYKIAGKIQYLTEVLPQIETNTILCKTLTGLGATYSEIKAKRHSVIIVPNVPPIIGKCWKIQCKLPPKTKRFCPLKTFNNAPLKSLDRWGYYYFRFSTV